MFSLHQLGRVGFCALAFVSFAWAQTTNPVEQQFAAYHQTLNSAAESLLAAPPPPAKDMARDYPKPRTVPSQRTSFATALGRVQQLRPLLEPILREEGLPADVAAVVLVESGGQATALSPKGARGLWQLMPETARRYGLTVSADRDERIDPIKATRAAARYLHDLYAKFGDWRLAFAAYNAGEQAVARVMLRIGSNEFQQLNALLPNETRAYVPAVMMARPLFGRAGTYNEGMLQAARTAHVLYASAQLDK